MLCIITVSYKSKMLLDANYDLVKALNPHTPFRWIVVQNTPPSHLQEDIAFEDPRFEVIQGPPLTREESFSPGYGSFHHTKALNIAINYVAQELVLVLEPDCFIFMPDWIETVFTHMKREKLVFFGVPYSLEKLTSYWYFPNICCMFINLQLMQKNGFYQLNFDPDLEKIYIKHRDDLFSTNSWLRNSVKIFNKRTWPPSMKGSDIFGLIKEKIIGEKLPKWGSAFIDSGIKIYKEYAHRFKHEECAVYGQDRRGPKKRFIERFFPASRCSFPRDKKVFVNEPSPFFEGVAGDQYFWKEEVFAFHVSLTHAHRRELVAENEKKLLAKVYACIDEKTKTPLAQTY